MSEITGPLIRPTPLYDASGRRLVQGGLPVSFPEHVHRMIEAEIIAGRLDAGERVTEDSLAKRLGLSRTPVREAMRVLEGQGLIVRRRSRGTYVAERTSSEESKALYELRVPLESFLAQQAAERIRAEDIETLRALQQVFEQTLSGQGAPVALRDLIVLDSDFHWTIYNAAESDLTSVVASYWGRLQRELYDRVYQSDQPSLFAQHHDHIITALENRDSAAARRLMAEHIQAGWKAIDASFTLAGADG
jgi:DNA-binding GntR family transcriptional regulator